MKRVIVHQDIYGMARVGKVQHRGTTYEIYVNSDDGGNIPHFHFRDMTDWDTFHTCIEIAQPRYFHHTGKEDVLNSRLKKMLNDFMKAPVNISRYKDKFKNNWELVCFLWDINNSDMELSEDIVQPDYRNLN